MSRGQHRRSRGKHVAGSAARIAAPPARRCHARRLLAATFALAVALFSASAVYAGLTAKATGTEQVSSGTLNLVLGADTNSVGFSNFAAKMAPGDVNNVAVDLDNTGTLASLAGMTLWVGGSPVNALTDGTAAGEGLAVTITQCSVAWSAGGTCGGSTTSILAQTMVSAMNSSGSAVALSNIPALAASSGQVAHLQVGLTLIGTETSTNGVAPSPTVQGLTTTLTYTFTEQQRAAVTTNQ
jgi:spore coat-associated protein N